MRKGGKRNGDNENSLSVVKWNLRAGRDTMDHLDPNVSVFALASREFDNSVHKLRVKDVPRGFIRERVATKAAPFAALAFTCQNASQKYTRSCQSVRLSSKGSQRFNGFTILATVRDCEDTTDPKLQVFKDLKLCNAKLFQDKSLQRALFYSFRFLRIEIYIAVSLIYLLCKCSSEFKDLKI